VVGKALAKEPSDRYATAGELGRDLQIIRRTLQATQDVAELDETRFASPAELRVLQEQLVKDAAAKPQPPHAAKSRNWRAPLAAAAGVLVVVSAFFLGNNRAGEPEGAAAAGPGTEAAATTAAPAAPTSRVLRVESIPAGAEVAVDGTPVNEITPAPVTLAGSGPFTLRLSKRGFVAQEVRLTEAEIARGSVTYTLAAAEVPRVAVTISSAYPVEVLSGSQTLAAAGTSHQLNVPVGSRLRVVAREYMLDTALSVPSKPLQYSTPPVGRLTVLTKYETCNVKIGDRVLGFPPITRMPIVAGQYRVDIVCQGGTNPPGQFVTVGPNESATVRVY
jgi:hypothetical protein